MKIICASVWIFLFSNFILGMHSQTPPTNAGWREQLKPLCENYLRYLETQYVCICTRYFHHTFNTATARDEFAKNKLIKELLSHLDVNDWNANKHLRCINNMAPFRDEYGLSFSDCATKILEPHCEDKCLICRDADATYIYFPCAHLVCCDECNDSIKKSSQRCSLCRGVSDLIRIEKKYDRCVCCETTQPKKLCLQCKGLVLCDECEVSTCPKCEKEFVGVNVLED